MTLKKFIDWNSNAYCNNSSHKNTVDITTPEGRVLTLHPEGSSDSPGSSSNPTERYAVQGEETEICNEPFKKAVTLT